MIGVKAEYESGALVVMQQFLLENGLQLGRLHEYLQVWRRKMERQGLVLEVMVGEHQPQVVALDWFRDVGEWREVGQRLKGDTELLAANQTWSAAGPYLEQRTTLLAGTGYCPTFQGLAPEQKLVEMRVYQAASEAQLNGVHERFAGPEIPIFHRCVIHPVFYGTTLAGAQMPNLTYLTPFRSLAEREAAWAKFQADPEWLKVKQESIAAHGFAPRVIRIGLYRAV